MSQLRIAFLTSLALLGSCSNAEERGPKNLISDIEPEVIDYSDAAPVNEFGFMEAMEQGPDPFGSSAPRARRLVTQAPGVQDGESQEQTAGRGEQQIAYAYGFGFQIDGGKIRQLQSEHEKMCSEMGPDCRVLRVSQATADSWDGYGEIEMQIAADKAGDLAEALSKPAEELGGELISSVKDGEDLTEQIIDSEARLQSRLVLRDKLTAILKSNRGSVDELVKAEKAVADINEEIDSARSKLEKYRNRIRYSAVRIEYEPYYGETQVGFVRPVMTAFRSMGSTLGMTIAAIVYTLTALIPIILAILGIRWILHRFGLRIRFWRKD